MASQLLDLSGGDQPAYRAIAPDIAGFNLIAEVTVSEDHTDEMLITDHPVEFGANMSDHAYKRPPECRVRVGWSNASGGYSGYAQAVYAQLLQLQISRQLFQLFTGKRFYNNMLVGDIKEITEDRTEFVFMADIRMRQIFLAQTQTTSAAQHANPAATAPTQDTGQTQVKAVPSVPAAAAPTPPITPVATGNGTTNSNSGGTPSPFAQSAGF